MLHSLLHHHHKVVMLLLLTTHDTLVVVVQDTTLHLAIQHTNHSPSGEHSSLVYSLTTLHSSPE